MVVALAVALALYFAYHVTRFRLSGLPLTPTRDAGIVYETVGAILQTGLYPARAQPLHHTPIFPYPPSALPLFGLLRGGGPTVFMALWLAAMAAGLATVARASVAGEARRLRAAWLLIAVLALPFADGPISWDLRNLNSNLIYLGLVLAGYAALRRHPLLAGALIGLSLSLKLYSGLLLPWLLLNGYRRSFVAAVAITLAAAAWPWPVFGPEGAARLYRGWLEQLEIIADPNLHALLADSPTGPPLVTLGRAAAALTGARPDAASTRTVVGLLSAAWVIMLLWYGWRAWRHLPVTAPSRAALADWTVLLLAPIPLSPWFEPYHAVALWPGTILCIAVTLDRDCRSADRWTAAGGLAGIAASRLVQLPFDLRGLLMLSAFLSVTAALGLLRPRLRGTPAEPEFRASS
ncbi:MAG TPA: glycosyltransferase 87 family protein [Xanthobacteraceae bacterium]